MGAIVRGAVIHGENIRIPSQRYDTNWPRHRHGHKYTKYKMCLGIMVVICIKQHLSNIWSSFMRKLSNIEAKLKKGVAYEKACMSNHGDITLMLKPEACNLLKKRLWHRCFPVSSAEFLRTPFLQNTSAQLLLYIQVTLEKCLEEKILLETQPKQILWTN